MARSMNRLKLGVETLELVLQEGSHDEEGVFANARVDREEDESESESDFDPKEEEIRYKSTSESSKNDNEKPWASSPHGRRSKASILLHALYD
ncbi:hypothetical protein PoB_000204800 [Plakobranchus ocellatus]|uniref:Uncharacterized protein n=1 Tax=Plakobranchus ocellatus TaxID=259542 RepID=A0AAV3XYU3_9GAST|nr:hypothetical protein PoB_000204800 [Plakobranchus ocellatus]